MYDMYAYVAMCGFVVVVLPPRHPLADSSASPLPKYEERDLEGDPSRSTHRPPDKAFKIQECHCFGASDHRSSCSYIIIISIIILHVNICLISHLT